MLKKSFIFRFLIFFCFFVFIAFSLIGINVKIDTTKNNKKNNLKIKIDIDGKVSSVVDIDTMASKSEDEEDEDDIAASDSNVTIISTHDKVSLFGDIVVKENERVEGSVVNIFGNIDLYGEVNGDVISIFGNIYAHDKSRVNGDAVVLFGIIDKSENAFLNGQQIFLGKTNSICRYKSLSITEILKKLLNFLIMFLIILGIYKIATKYIDTRFDYMMKNPKKIFFIGFISIIAIPFVIIMGIILLITIIGIPISLLLIIFYIFSFLVGRIFISLLIGSILLSHKGTNFKKLVIGFLFIHITLLVLPLISKALTIVGISIFIKIFLSLLVFSFYVFDLLIGSGILGNDLKELYESKYHSNKNDDLPNQHENINKIESTEKNYYDDLPNE